MAAGAGAGAGAGESVGIGGVQVTWREGILISGRTSLTAWFIGPLITAFPSFMIIPATPTADCSTAESTYCR